MSKLYVELEALAEEADDEVRDAISKLLQQRGRRVTLPSETPQRTPRRPATRRVEPHT